MILQGVPVVSQDTLEAFKDEVLEKMNECCPVKRIKDQSSPFSTLGESLYVPLDKAKKCTQPWMAVECVTAKGPAQLAKKLPSLLMLLKTGADSTRPLTEEGEKQSKGTTTPSSTDSLVIASEKVETKEGEATVPTTPVKSEGEKVGTLGEKSESTEVLKEKKVGSTEGKEAVKISALKEVAEGEGNTALLHYCRHLLFDVDQDQLNAEIQTILQSIFTDLAEESPGTRFFFRSHFKAAKWPRASLRIALDWTSSLRSSQ